jgi:hypothetical protein
MSLFGDGVRRRFSVLSRGLEIDGCRGCDEILGHILSEDDVKRVIEDAVNGGIL